jgi:hypothetical protein
MVSVKFSTLIGTGSKRECNRFQRFLRRWSSELSRRQGSRLESSRAQMTNPHAIKQFFEKYKKIVYDNDILPEDIYNMDETGRQLMVGKINVIGRKGAKRAQVTDGMHSSIHGRRRN